MFEQPWMRNDSQKSGHDIWNKRKLGRGIQLPLYPFPTQKVIFRIRPKRIHEYVDVRCLHAMNQAFIRSSKSEASFRFTPESTPPLCEQTGSLTGVFCREACCSRRNRIKRKPSSIRAFRVVDSLTAIALLIFNKASSSSTVVFIHKCILVIWVYVNHGRNGINSWLRPPMVLPAGKPKNQCHRPHSCPLWTARDLAPLWIRSTQLKDKLHSQTSTHTPSPYTISRRLPGRWAKQNCWTLWIRLRFPKNIPARCRDQHRPEHPPK
jgi:hypothetical protein